MNLAAGKTSGPARIVSVVFLVFGADTLFQTVVPVALRAEARLSTAAIGLVMGTALGVGLVVSPIAGKLSDCRGRPSSLVPALGAVLVGTVLTGLLGAAGLLFVVIAALIYGFGRSSAIVVTLAGVADAPGNRQRVQGLNSSAQRLSAILAALVAALALWTRHWDIGYAVILVFFSGAMLASAHTKSAELRSPTDQHGWYRAVPEAFTLLRLDRRLWASSLLNLTNIALVSLGNSFLPLTLSGTAHSASGAVIVILACRDLTATGVGLAYPSLSSRVGVRGSVAICSITAVSGLGLFAVGGSTLSVALVLGAALQGVALATSIASTNLLATASGTGRGLRLASTMYLSALGSLVLPVLFGVVLQVAGAQLLYLVGAGTVATALALAVWYLRPHRSSSFTCAT